MDALRKKVSDAKDGFQRELSAAPCNFKRSSVLSWVLGVWFCYRGSHDRIGIRARHACTCGLRPGRFCAQVNIFLPNLATALECWAWKNLPVLSFGHERVAVPWGLQFCRGCPSWCRAEIGADLFSKTSVSRSEPKPDRTRLSPKSRFMSIRPSKRLPSYRGSVRP